jgi:thermitase
MIHARSFLIHHQNFGLVIFLILTVIQAGCGDIAQIPAEFDSIPPVDNYSVPPYPPMPYEQGGAENFTTAPLDPPVILSSEEVFSVPYREDAILVMFDPRSDSLPYRTHSPLSSQVIHDYAADGMPGLQLVSPPARISVQEAVAYYQAQPGVRYAEPDYYRFADRIPSDPDFWRQWGHLNTGQVYREESPPGTPGADIKSADAWDMITGGDQIVAVLDSGVDYLHPDLTANIWQDPDTGTFGYDAITGDLEPMDLASHGTHCAGIIGAVGDNWLGTAGVAWQTRIMPIRFLNSFGTGTVSDEIASILWATKHGARVISCSYGSRSYSRAEHELMNETDALFVCAAGNAGVNIDQTPYYPASLDLPNLITVTATDPNDNLADFSNFGSASVDLGAPGVDIYSTKHNIYEPVPIWRDPFDTFANWTGQGNWTLNTEQYVSPLSSATGFVNRTGDTDNQSPVILTLQSPFKVSDLENPVLSYSWSLVGRNWSFSVEGSADGFSWQPLEYTRGDLMLAPFIHRECKIPVDMRTGHLYIRFVADGEFCILGLDDVTLADGYGTLVETRWGYMDGTSMACPQVAGMAAMLMSAAPEASVRDIRDIILVTTAPVPSLTGKTGTGGRADLAAAIEKITGGSSYHLRLSPGWNHVSVPLRLIPGSDTAADVFGSLPNVSGHSLYRYESGDWIVVKPAEQVTQLTSYWVYTGSSAALPLMVDEDQTGHPSRNLSYGWNGIGIKGEENRAAKDELRSVDDIWTYVVGFNATVQRSDEPIVRGGSGTQNDSRMLEPYQGYWIYLTRNGTFEKREEDPIPVPVSPEMNQPIWPVPLR